MRKLLWYVSIAIKIGEGNQNMLFINLVGVSERFGVSVKGRML